MTSSPPASSDHKRRAMQLQRERDTQPELALRRALHVRGLRYRVHCRPVPSVRRTVDIVFGPARVAVEVRGCFWHACPEHATYPKANAEWWAKKLDTNRRRDAETEVRLAEAGWHLEVVWEHEEPEGAADRIERLVRRRKPRRL